MDGDIIVAVVRGVSTHRPTYGNPPRVELDIQERLRGDPKVKRSPARWQPPSHDIDYVGGDSAERLREWKARPMPQPEVGCKWILWGKFGSPQTGFVVWSDPRLPYSEDSRREALGMIQEGEQWLRRTRAEYAARCAARAEAQAKWRARVSAKDIERYCKEADFVAIGKYAGRYSGFEVSEVLKGFRRDLDDLLGRDFHAAAPSPYHALVAMPRDIWPLLDWDALCLLFLSEKNAVLYGSQVQYTVLPETEGFVLADAEALRAARGALANAAKKELAPLLLICDGGEPTQKKVTCLLEKAGQHRFTLLRQGVRVPGFGLPGSDGEIPPGGNAWVECYFEVGRREKVILAAWRFGQGKKQLVFRDKCDPKSEKELTQAVDEIIRRLLDPNLDPKTAAEKR
jgi:hypothetical protein